MKKGTVDMKWLPPSCEWDFRAVSAEECRFACQWEYAREASDEFAGGNRLVQVRIAERDWGDGNFGRFPGVDTLVENGLPFPSPWMALPKNQVKVALASLPRMPSIRVTPLKQEIEQKLKRPVAISPEAWLRGTEDGFVFRFRFTPHGVEAVIKEMESWIRNEAKKAGRSPRAKAAEVPYDLLKWLAVCRLERARKKAGLTCGAARAALEVYRCQNRLFSPGSDGFPSYAGDAAWCKARSDGCKFLGEFLENPYNLLSGRYPVF